MIAEIAALAGDPARANILTALLDGRAMTATELSYAARVTPQTTSAHLGKLTEAGLITATPQGRHRYFRLASPKVAQMLESIVAVAGDNRPPRYRPLSRLAAELRDARMCYDHLAGQLGVRIADAMVARGYLVLEDEGGRITEAGTRYLWELGIDTRVAGKGRRHLCRACLDWTERRPHVGGAIGAALAERWLALGWIKRAKDSRAITVTPEGERGFRDSLGMSVVEDEKAVA